MDRRIFLQRAGMGAAGVMGATALGSLGLLSCAGFGARPGRRPNIVLCMADDMGFSDIGSFGAEISTPNLDRLAANGAKLTQFYNGARCCPTRASLLTGLYPHQAGIGYMNGDWGHDSYRGDLNDRCVTMAEALGLAGYRTYMSGKWHVTGHDGHWSGNPERQSKHNWPIQRGFDRFFGTIIGAGSFFDPITLVDDNEPVDWIPDDFYYTDAINDSAVGFIDDHFRSGTDQPFFAYVSHVAPHWPLHALRRDIEKYRGRYHMGWDRVREERLARMRRSGLIPAHLEITARDPRVPPWDAQEDKEYWSRAMEVYAAQIDSMDQGIGRIVRRLEQEGELENTLIVFLADNGGCAEILTEGWRHYLFIPGQTRDGRPIQIGNDPDHMPGPDDTYQSYGIGWANASNTPFRLYKHFVHEGGIASPMIMHWPAGIAARDVWRHHPSHLIDLMPTFLDVAGADYPERFAGQEILPVEGRSLMPYVREDRPERKDALFWEHGGNSAVRDGRWKLVRRHEHDWELFDMHGDRTETRDLAADMPEKTEELRHRYDEWAARVGVLPWPAQQYIQQHLSAGAT